MRTNKEIIEEFRKRWKVLGDFLMVKYGTHIHSPQLQKFAEEFILQERKALIKEFLKIVGEDEKINNSKLENFLMVNESKKIRN